MRNIRSRNTINTIKHWARVAAKLGLLLTEPGVRDAVGDQVKGRVDNLTDTVARKYEDAVDRLEAAGAALQGRSSWPSRTVGFLLGMGLGAGFGILFAPRAGSETREAIRGTAIDVKNKVVESASMATGKTRQSVTSMPSTGTEG
jgi:YtxH-like protein